MNTLTLLLLALLWGQVLADSVEHSKVLIVLLGWMGAEPAQPRQRARVQTPGESFMGSVHGR